MATRCNIIVRFSSTVVYLYRHWDGYPAETGADLVDHYRAALPSQNAGDGAAHRFLRSLLCAKRGGDGRDSERTQYEVTTEVHGDVQYIYEFDFTEAWRRSDLYIPITVRERPRFSDEDHTKWPVTYHKDANEFAQLVNAERVETNKRLAALARKDRSYAAAKPYDLIPIFSSVTE